MKNDLEEYVDLLTNEIEQQNKFAYSFDHTGDIKKGIIIGLELSRELLTEKLE